MDVFVTEALMKGIERMLRKIERIELERSHGRPQDIIGIKIEWKPGTSPEKD